MTVLEHYNNYLGNFYSWIIGDLQTAQATFRKWLMEQQLVPSQSGVAIDLGAGNGLQSIPLAQQGYYVIAIDFNDQLVQELRENANGFPIEIVKEDIRSVAQYESRKPELIVCCGDTLTHLETKTDVVQFLSDCIKTLQPGGKLILSFRDYSTELTGTHRFIPVKSDENRILTCILDYEPGYVTVTDLLHERSTGVWQQHISSYRKVRFSPDEIIHYLSFHDLGIPLKTEMNGMITIIAIKP